MHPAQIAIIGGGPAGLMAAETLSLSGHAVHVYESMPTMGRKFMLAGKSGLNLTHAEDYERFASRFGAATPFLRGALDAFGPADIRDWAEGLGTETFIGTSGRVFPKAMKASPLLRAWLGRLESRGVSLHVRYRWSGFSGNRLLFETQQGVQTVFADAVLLALGGASWPRLGSDAAWVPWLREQGVDIAGFRPANCGFDIDWSDEFRTRFSGTPLKSVTATSGAGTFPGEFIVSKHGIEGSLVYQHSAALRDDLDAGGRATLLIDLAPGRTEARLEHDLAKQSAKASLSNRLRKAAGIEGVKLALMREIGGKSLPASAGELARLVKALTLSVVRTRPIAEAISSAGGIGRDQLNENYMLKPLPGVFAAGEMLDWEAPTGGYLLSACLATGKAAARGMETWLRER